MSGIGIGLGEGEALGSEVAVTLSRLGQLLKLPTISSGPTITGAPSAGDQIVIGGPRLQTPNTNIFSPITDFFSNLFKTPASPISPKASDITNTATVPRVSTPINPNVIAGSAAVGATAIGGTIILTNPGVQQTAQSYSQGFNSLAQGFSTVSSTLTSNPLILIALIGLGVIVILKK
ncbi:MAG: hypothetical protein KGI06_06150 [Candidatus Micrarchaeota archaeon]|nr:hypothetical protein [Candidatus Micrarchaeota archaeon]